MGKGTILALVIAAFALPAAAAETLRDVAVTTSEAQVRLYDSPDGGSTGTRAKEGFPARVYVLQESATGRIRIRFPDTGQAVWVRGRDVRIVDAPAAALQCDPVTRTQGQQTALVAQATRGARGAGVGECR